ncbi:ABC transporter substrate-binding protein [Minwuia thermotolerans]|uniref:Peptide ABC transporter substrate-binding protein n=1 Tax=Minwuia thermotolerans TaxID=2056226 RepID=A0A2M9FWG2_9PROT|nr:ABC transporter substrate-binding protein [Minwuia thermotolerans]PJK27783.1 peptide ABC transporter substrate-binding protein [Minwuia thermotolerans]
MTYRELKRRYETGRLDRRSFLQGAAAVGALGAASVLAAPQAQARKKGGTMRMGKAHGQTTDTLDPGTAENGFTTALLYGVHGFMTEVGDDGSLRPGVAESWEASPDAKVWTFKLRPGVIFHSGKTLDASDVVASVNHHRGEESTSAAGPIVKPIKDIRTPDDMTVVFELEAGNADFPFVLSDYHLVIGPAKDGKLDWKSGDGCGAYRLTRFDPGVAAEFEKFADFWDDGRGFFDEIEMLCLVDLNARTTALVSGDVDAIDRLDLKTVGLLGRRPGVDIHSVAGNQHYTFAMSTNHDPYTDNNVRLALKHAVNREELVEKILFGYGTVGNDHPIGRGQRYYNDEMAQTSYDPDKAKYHLKQAGMDSLEVSLSASDAAFGGAVDAAVLFQNSAKEAGIDINVVREPNDGYWSDVWMKKPFSAVYWSGRPVEDQMFSTAYQTDAAWNDTFWSNERFDELLIAARAELDEAKRREMYYEMQAILNQNGGAIIPMFASWVFATTDKVGHGEFASNWDLDGERWMERWWFK